MRRLVLAAGIFLWLVPGRAYLARAPDLIKQTFVYRGEAARTFVRLLGLPADRTATLELELSQSAELSAMPERDKLLREPDGTLSSELRWRTSSLAKVVVDWDPATVTLRIEGWVLDMRTGHPTAAGPTWRVVSPAAAHANDLPGWRPLVARLGDQDVIEVSLGGGEIAKLEHLREHTWDSKNRPTERSTLILGFGPALGAPAGCTR